MATYLTNRDGGKTNEEGHIRFQTKIWNGNIVDGMQAVQRSPLAMGVNITVGDAKVDYSTYGYTVWTDAVEAVSISTADPSNPRIDRIVGYVDRSVTPSTASANNPSILKFMAIAGTPASSPSAPSDVTVQAAVGASNPYFDIANVLVGTGVTTISDANITDTRVFLTVPANSVPNSALQGGVTYAKLLSTIFSGEVHTYTNTGDGGGTGYYINLGGLKLCWGKSGSFTKAGSCSASFPTGFFSTVGTCNWNIDASSVISYVGSGFTTSGVSIFTGSSATLSLYWFAIGT